MSTTRALVLIAVALTAGFATAQAESVQVPATIVPPQTPPASAPATGGHHGDHHPLFDCIDANHDGSISLAEWEAFKSEHPCKHAHPEAAKAHGDGHPVFDRIDANHDGSISLAEWEAARAAHREHRQEHQAGTQAAATTGIGGGQRL